MQQQFQKMKESQLEMKRRLVDMRLGSNSDHRQKRTQGNVLGMQTSGCLPEPHVQLVVKALV